jgi:hypothetical protein
MKMYRPRTIADAVDKVARQSAGKDWGLYASLLGHWAEIVGPEYAKVTTPVKITFPYQPKAARRENGVLTVRLPKGLAMEFSFRSEMIRQKVNTYMGYEAFARIALDAASLPVQEVKIVREVDPADLKVIQEEASVIENSELRAALEKFGEALSIKK